MTIIQFPNSSRVEIYGGVVQHETVTDDKGTRPVLTNVGSSRFFVEVVEKDGGRIGMWDGPSYDEAIRQATILSMDFGPVRDLVVGGGE